MYNHPAAEAPISSLFVTPAIRVKSLLIRDTGIYHNQYLRPFQTETNSTVAEFVRNHNPLVPVDANAVAGIANQFITPHAQPGAEVSIANGFGEKRFRFMMEVETTTGSGFFTTTELIMGYTDYQGASFLNQTHGLIDPQMTFYINSVTRLRVQQTQQGTQNLTVLNNNLLLAPQEAPEQFFNPMVPVQQLHNMLPSKLAANLAMKQWDYGAELVDTGLNVNSPMISSRANNNSAQYLGRTLSSYQKSMVNPDYDSGDSYRALLNSTANRLQEAQFSDAGFLPALSSIYNQLSNVFTYRDLQTMDPNIDNVVEIRLAVDTMNYREFTDPTTGADISTRFALVLNNSLPGMMMDHTITWLKFRASNRTINGQPYVHMDMPRSFVSVDLSVPMQIIQDRILVEVLNSVSANNQIEYDIMVECNIAGDTKIDISINGSPYTPFVFPTFSDALFSPMLTRNIHDVNTMLGNLNDIFGTMTDGYDRMRTQQVYGGQDPMNPYAPPPVAPMGQQGMPLAPDSGYTPTINPNQPVLTI